MFIGHGFLLVILVFNICEPWYLCGHFFVTLLKYVYPTDIQCSFFRREADLRCPHEMLDCWSGKTLYCRNVKWIFLLICVLSVFFYSTLFLSKWPFWLLGWLEIFKQILVDSTVLISKLPFLCSIRGVVLFLSLSCCSSSIYSFVHLFDSWVGVRSKIN